MAETNEIRDDSIENRPLITEETESEYNHQKIIIEQKDILIYELNDKIEILKRIYL